MRFLIERHGIDGFIDVYDVYDGKTPLDLSLEASPVGMATRTIFEKAEIVLWRTGEAVFLIEIARPFAPYLSTRIDIALRENAAAP